MLTTSFPRAPGDAAGSFVAAGVADLRARGHDATVLAPGRGWAPDGVRRVRYPAPGGLLAGHGAPDVLENRPLSGHVAGLAASAALLAATARHAPTHDRIVAHWLVPCGLAAVLAGRRPAVLYAHGGDVALLERLPGGARLARTLDARAEGLVFVSEDLRRRFAALLGREPRARHHVLPMGIAAPAPHPARVEALRRSLHGRRVVVTVGRFVPIKGHDVLARALAGRGDVVWIAAGEGPERDRVRALARGVDARFPGPVLPAERDALFAVADVVVLPSRPVAARTEGTPLVLLEAMAAGRPVIASATGGIPAAAGPGVCLVPPGDVAALRAAVDGVLAEPGDAGAANARHAARHLWSHVGAAHAAALGL